uniref:Uncharacterized protein n=1 Tax=Chromera velia CCMP2878 TaxID=1169474 RepID=A0A0G4G3A7_9ALVE|eukprot:Cvel_20072.t1-p1 / transcript=Cvel_20072.t1 / gene=Cvel_20072 / organism=Chromera_velia_CCMP2878 / gene_product=Putative ankyrin repeat protein L93, putative / transcript_product=Putative ankyrin repeat protein L93, putative / location=Cvel_scaffold1776:4289-5428(-) / protein_length=380 / sequence_SO=supercontig / SO=protein_coding / is_pseudo=false
MEVYKTFLHNKQALPAPQVAPNPPSATAAAHPKAVPSAPTVGASLIHFPKASPEPSQTVAPSTGPSPSSAPNKPPAASVFPKDHRSDARVDPGGLRTLRVPLRSRSMEVKTKWEKAGGMAITIDWRKISLSELYRSAAGIVLRSFKPVTTETLFAAVKSFSREKDDDLRLLLLLGAQIDGLHKDRTPLMWAITIGREWANLEAVRLLAEAGANLEVKTPTLWLGGGFFAYTALHLACIHNEHEVLAFLLSRGADIHAKEYYEHTGLHITLLYGHRESTQVLLDRGARVDTRNLVGHTPLHYAVLPYPGKQNASEVVELLLARGADMEAKDTGTLTVLLTAVLYGSVEMVKLLLDRGANIHARDAGMRTGLDRTAPHRHVS